MKIIIIVGARPNFVKAAPIVRALNKYRNQLKYLIVHTGQHYDDEMSKVFFEDLSLPTPDIHLGIGSGSHAEQTAMIMIELEKKILKMKPDLVMVLGDINSTMAGAVSAAKLCIPVAHVEAGLRSFDRNMPEEINRIVTDSISDYLFTTCEEANINLLKEGHPKNRIYFVGNFMIDTLLAIRKKAMSSKILSKLGLKGNRSVKPYGVLTLHRPSNVDDKKALRNILEAIKFISKEMSIIFPIHPRTKKQIDKYEFRHFLNYVPYEELSNSENSSTQKELSNRINCINPLGILDFSNLISNAKLVLTDSGGITEETTILKVPCLSLRDNTEREITIKEGTNMLVGNNKQRIIDGALKQLQKDYKELTAPKYWDGKAAERIVKVLLKIENEK